MSRINEIMKWKAGFVCFKWYYWNHEMAKLVILLVAKKIKISCTDGRSLHPGGCDSHRQHLLPADNDNPGFICSQKNESFMRIEEMPLFPATKLQCMRHAVARPVITSRRRRRRPHCTVPVTTRPVWRRGWEVRWSPASCSIAGSTWRLSPPPGPSPSGCPAWWAAGTGPASTWGRCGRWPDPGAGRPGGPGTMDLY